MGSLLGHGFCLPHNPADVVPLRLGAGVAASAAESKVRQRALHEAGLEPLELHELSRRQPLPPRLLATLRILLMREAALSNLLCKGTATNTTCSTAVGPRF